MTKVKHVENFPFRSLRISNGTALQLKLWNCEQASMSITLYWVNPVTGFFLISYQWVTTTATQLRICCDLYGVHNSTTSIVIHFALLYLSSCKLQFLVSQFYTPKRCTPIQVLPPVNAYTKFLCKTLILGTTASLTASSPLVYALAGGSTGMSVRLFGM